MTKMSSTERKRVQRERDRLSGWVEVTVKVAHDQVAPLRAFAAALPPPEPPTDPRQLDLLEAIDEQLRIDRAR